jgi:putative toxin-antitoxin system antitoxin component (TIGR02293 family)
MDQHENYLYHLRIQAVAECIELFEGDTEAAERWMSKPVRGLAFRTPNDLLESETGIEQLRLLVGRLEHGIPS